jgi:transcriptional regulator PpsR
MTRVNIAQPDITLMLDNDGVIRSASLSNAVEAETVAEWLGRPWAETVGEVGSDRVRRMLDDARRNGVSAFRQVTQRFPSGLEMPVEYTTVRLGGAAGLLAVGKNLQAVAELQSRLIAAQQAREQDYWKLREIETRSRLLFDASSEAVLLVRADTLRIVEANPAAIRALGMAPGWEFLREVAPRDQDALQNMLLRARKHGRVPGILIHVGADQAPWVVRASMMTAEPGLVFLLQLGHVGSPLPTPAPGNGIPLDELMDRLPDAFLVLDPQGCIRRANQAFLNLVQVTTESSIIGEKLGRWLSQPGAAASMLFAQLQQHGSIRLYATQLTGDLGAEAEVEISAAGVAEGGSPFIAMVIRDVSRRLPMHDVQDNLRAALGAVAERIGKTPLPVMVRDTAEVVERHCIETALRLTHGKRSAAAELLGLSRQSLYAKLERYGIDDAPEGAREAIG